jgi:hypothetical protein
MRRMALQKDAAIVESIALHKLIGRLEENLCARELQLKPRFVVRVEVRGEPAACATGRRGTGERGGPTR